MLRRSYINIFFSALLLAAIGMATRYWYVGLSAGALGYKQEQGFATIKASLLALGSVAIPLGPTELEQRAVRRVLRYTGIMNLEVPGEPKIFVYAAYWAGDVISPREVAFHTPDNCWVNAGWRCIDKSSGSSLKSLADWQQPKARTFVANGDTAYVMYWHIFGGKIVTYGDGTRPDGLSWATDLAKFGLNLRQPQIFIRIHSSVPIAQLSDQRAVSVVTRLVSELTTKPN